MVILEEIQTGMVGIHDVMELGTRYNEGERILEFGGHGGVQHFLQKGRL